MIEDDTLEDQCVWIDRLYKITNKDKKHTTKLIINFVLIISNSFSMTNYKYQ